MVKRMCNKIKKAFDKWMAFRRGNRIVLRHECSHTVTACRRNETEPGGHVTLKNTGEILLLDLLCVLAAIHALCSLCRGLCSLWRRAFR